MEPIAVGTTSASAGWRGSRMRLVGGFFFVAVTLGACALLGKRFTHTSWPLQHAHMGYVGGAVFFYFASYVFRALGWQKLFPRRIAP